MLHFKKIFILLSILLVLPSCEDVIDLDLPEGRNQIVVDAFVSSEKKEQQIILTWSAGYFDNSLPKGVAGAGVFITGSDGSLYRFSEAAAGKYTYDAANMPAIDSVGTLYTFHLKYEGNEYISKSFLNPVPPIDQIGFYTSADNFEREERNYAEFFATDISGRTDYYWIKSYIQGNQTQPYSFRLLKDASFIGDNSDGMMFDILVRRSINDGEFELVKGDTVKVELRSISESAYNFLGRVNTESRNGGLFSVPPANIQPNITDIAGEKQDNVLGVFTMVSKSSLEEVY